MESYTCKQIGHVVVFLASVKTTSTKAGWIWHEVCTISASTNTLIGSYIGTNFDNKSAICAQFGGDKIISINIRGADCASGAFGYVGMVALMQ